MLYKLLILSCLNFPLPLLPEDSLICLLKTCPGTSTWILGFCYLMERDWRALVRLHLLYQYLFSLFSSLLFSSLLFPSLLFPSLSFSSLLFSFLFFCPRQYDAVDYCSGSAAFWRMIPILSICLLSVVYNIHILTRSSKSFFKIGPRP